MTSLDLSTLPGSKFEVTAEGSKEIDLARKQVAQQTPPNIKCGE